MSLIRSTTLALALTFLAPIAMAQTFDQATESMLQKSQEKKTGLTFHVDGQAIGAYVVEAHEEYLVVANREFSRIVIRRSSIDAVSMP